MNIDKGRYELYLKSNAHKNFSSIKFSDAGRWKNLGVPVIKGGQNLPPMDGIGLTDLPNIGGASGPPGPPGSGITA